MHQLRFAVGVSLLMAVLVVLISGFIVRTRSDFQFILLGFVLGLFTVYAIERLKRADREFMCRPAKAPVLGNAPSMQG